MLVGSEVVCRVTPQTVHVLRDWETEMDRLTGVDASGVLPAFISLSKNSTPLFLWGNTPLSLSVRVV